MSIIEETSKITKSFLSSDPIIIIVILLVGIVGATLYWAHVERQDARKDNIERLMPTLEKLSENLGKIADTYSGK